jgi:hypothetical protein
MKTIVTFLALSLTCCTGYAVRPPAVVDPRVYDGADPRLPAAVVDCQKAISAAYNDAKRAQRWAAWLSFVGGGVAATGAAAGGGIALLWPQAQVARAGAIAAGAVALAGAFVVLAARVPEGPEVAIERMAAAQREWSAGIDAADTAPAVELHPGDPRYARAMNRLQACIVPTARAQ